MDIRELIPKHKSDIETAEKLKACSYEEIKPIIPDLLECLQDCNWPVSRPVANYLVTISEHLTGDIVKILQGNDDIWKYWCLRVFAVRATSIAPALMDEIKRIASQPTQSEIDELVHETALEILEERK
jgi:hypothetical protein